MTEGPDLTPTLGEDERDDTAIVRFRGHEAPMERLSAFLDGCFWPSDVRDFGEVPTVRRHFRDANTTCEIWLEPTLNDHYPDDLPRSVMSVAFCLDQYSPLSQGERRLRLGDVDPGVMADVLGGLCEVYRDR